MSSPREPKPATSSVGARDSGSADSVRDPGARARATLAEAGASLLRRMSDAAYFVGLLEKQAPKGPGPQPDPRLSVEQARDLEAASYSFETTLRRIEGPLASRQAGDRAAFSPTDVHQGAVGDCWLMAQLAAQAAAAPERLADVITEESPGVFLVRLHLHDPKTGQRALTEIRVDATFPVLEASADKTEYRGVVYGKGPAVSHGHELWPMLLEKAFAQHLGAYTKLGGTANNHSLRGFGDAFAAMSGVPSKLYQVRALARAVLRDHLQRASAEGRPAIFSAYNRTPEPTDPIIPNHTYSFLSLDAHDGVELIEPLYAKPLKVTLETLAVYFETLLIGEAKGGRRAR